MPIRSTPLHILLVEEDPADVQLVRELLSVTPLETYQLDHVGRLADARESLAGNEVDVVLLALGLPDGRGLHGVAEVCRLRPDVPVVILSSVEQEAVALQAIREHAQDYLIKGELTPAILYRSIRYSIERHRSQENIRLLFGVSPDGLLVVRPDGTVLLANSAAASLLACDLEELQGTRCGLPLAAEAGETVHLSSDRVAEMRVVPTRWQEQPAYLVALRDVTERSSAGPSASGAAKGEEEGPGPVAL